MVVKQRFPGLMCADCIVLLADNWRGMQLLGDICGKEGETLGFKFSVMGNLGFMVLMT